MADRNQQPKDLQDVLRMAIEHTPAASEEPSNAQALSGERRDFLAEALSNLPSQQDPVKIMKIIVGDLTSFLDNPDAVSPEDLEAVEEKLCEELESLTDWCENIDWACDFQKIGGFKVFQKLQDYSTEFRWRCSVLIATLCQNNPYCQEKILTETSQLDHLMSQVSSESNDREKIKACLAISGLLRGCSQAQEEFIKRDGYSFLLKCMQSDVQNLKTKATFLLTNLMAENENHKENLTKMGCVEQLLTMLHGSHCDKTYDPYHEALMAALLQLLIDNPAAAKEARRPQLQLDTFLETRIGLLNNVEECQEEVDSAKQILADIFNSSEPEVDR